MNRPTVMMLLAIVSYGAHAGEQESPYRLSVSTEQDAVAVGNKLRIEYCLAAVGAEKRKLCLGVDEGYELSGARMSIKHFGMAPDADTGCTCAVPATLDSREPLCWPRYIGIPNLGGREIELTAFVTVLEGAHLEGGSVESCLEIRSELLRVIVDRDKQTPGRDRGPEI